MYFLQYRILPADEHPEAEQLGEGLVCCWIDRASLAEADRFARRDIARQKWLVVQREYGEEVTEADYEDNEEFLGYYQQALIDHEVFVYNQSPRYPVYWVTASVEKEPPTEPVEAHYFLCGSFIEQEGEDVYDPAFWTGEVKKVALDAAVEAITEAGWNVRNIVAKRPCGRNDVPEVLVRFYDEAEEEGACLAFFHEGDPDGEDVAG
jgi:hypothetical protein